MGYIYRTDLARKSGSYEAIYRCAGGPGTIKIDGQIDRTGANFARKHVTHVHAVRIFLIPSPSAILYGKLPLTIINGLNPGRFIGLQPPGGGHPRSR